MPKVAIKDLTDNIYQPQRDGIDQLADSMMAIGQVTPIVVSPEKDGFIIIAGHRRVSAAEKLGWTEIEAVVLEGDELTQLASLAADNIQREDFSEMQQVQLCQEMLDLGADVQMVADVTGFGVKSIKSTTKAAKKIDVQADPALMNMSLGEALVYNEIGQNSDLKSLLDQARGTERWDHTAARVIKQKTELDNIEKASVELQEANVTIVEQPGWDDKVVVQLSTMCPSGTTLAAFALKHKDECAGHAAYISTDYQGAAHVHYVCTDAPSYHDWKGKEKDTHQQAELDKAREGRQFKKDMAAPTEVRRQWIKDILLKKKVTKGEWEFLAYALAYRNSHTTDLALEFARSKRTPSGQEGNNNNFNRDFIGKPEPKSRILSLAMVLAYMDEETRLCQGLDHFRATHVPHYLTYLKKNGYVLSEHEEKFLCGD